MPGEMDLDETVPPAPGGDGNPADKEQRPIAGTKRVRDARQSDASTTEEEVMRARALVCRKVNNERDTPDPDDGDPSALYKANYHPFPKVRLAPIKPGEFMSHSMLLDDLMYHNAAAPAWEVIARTTDENPALGKVALAIPFGWEYSHDTVAEMVVDITNTIQSLYQCKNVIVTAPQPHSPPRKPRIHGPPYAFLVQGLSREVHKEAVKQYAICTRDKTDKITALGIHDWFMRPKEHVVTLEGIYARESTPETEAELTRYVREHIKTRKDTITSIITAHADEYGGDAFRFPQWFEALVASVTAEACVDPHVPGERRRRRVYINIYAFGAFTDSFSCKEWARSILGDTVALGRFGIAAPAKTPLSCSYCHEGDHHVRVCKVLQHEHWFHKPAAKPNAVKDDDDEEGWKKAKGSKRGGGGKKPVRARSDGLQGSKGTL